MLTASPPMRILFDTTRTLPLLGFVLSPNSCQDPAQFWVPSFPL